MSACRLSVLIYVTGLYPSGRWSAPRRLGQHFGPRRVYVGRLCPTLFGDWTLLCEWRRSGSPAAYGLRAQNYAEAEKAERQVIKGRLQRGYSERSLRGASNCRLTAFRVSIVGAVRRVN